MHKALARTIKKNHKIDHMLDQTIHLSMDCRIHECNALDSSHRFVPRHPYLADLSSIGYLGLRSATLTHDNWELVAYLVTFNSSISAHAIDGTSP